MNPVVLTKGSPHLYDLGNITSTEIKTFDLDDEKKTSFNIREIKTKNIETIKKRFFRNLMAARIKSYSFATRILPETTLVYNSGAVGDPFTRVPTANLVEVFINEILKDSPEDEEEVINHYVDDINRLGGVDLKTTEVGKIRNRVESWLTDDVGRVVGKAA
jgi:hypothetical protein